MRLKHLVYFIATLPFVLLLAACGGGDTGEQSSQSGVAAPDFTMTNAAGGEVSLSDYEDKPVLLYFHMAVG